MKYSHSLTVATVTYQRLQKNETRYIKHLIAEVALFIYGIVLSLNSYSKHEFMTETLKLTREQNDLLWKHYETDYVRQRQTGQVNRVRSTEALTVNQAEDDIAHKEPCFLRGLVAPYCYGEFNFIYTAPNDNTSRLKVFYIIS